MTLAARVCGVGVVGPGLVDWSAGREPLAQGRVEVVPTVIPAPELLPANERRRSGKNVRIALAAGLEACLASGLPPQAFASVFASSSGDGDNCHAICEALASDDRAISPTRFHNSVHNTPSGYWTIATKSTRPSDSVGAFDGSFAAGLLEALARIADGEDPVLLVAYDVPYPQPLQGARPMSDAFAVALALRPADHGGGRLIRASLSREEPTVAGSPALEAMRLTIPTARSLPLLACLARAGDGTAVVEYQPGTALRIEVGA